MVLDLFFVLVPSGKVAPRPGAEAVLLYGGAVLCCRSALRRTMPSFRTSAPSCALKHPVVVSSFASSPLFALPFWYGMLQSLSLFTFCHEG